MLARKKKNRASTRDQQRNRPWSEHLVNEEEAQQTRASIGFHHWTKADLLAALTDAGVQVTQRMTHSELVRLAKDRFDNRRRTLPHDRSGNRVRYTSRRTGVKYLEAPQENNTERPTSVKNNDYVFFQSSPIGNWASKAVRMLGSVPPPSSFRSLDSLEEGNAGGGFFLEMDDEESEDEDPQEREHIMMEEFMEPSVKKAKAHADEYHPRRKDGSKYGLCSLHSGRHLPRFGALGDCLCCGAPESDDLARFGVGVSLYFKFLKFLGWLFLFLSFIVSPQLYFNITSYQGKLFTGIGFLEATTLLPISEQGFNRSVSTFTFGGVNFVKPFLDCDDDCLLNRERLGFLYMWTNVGVVLTFLFAIGYLIIFERKSIHEASKRSISVDEYTIQVVRTPENCGEGALKRFFTELTGEPVLDVSIAQNNGKLIDLYMRRGAIIHKLWKMGSKVYRLRQEAAELEEEFTHELEGRHASLILERIEREKQSRCSWVYWLDRVYRTAEKAGLRESELARAVSKYDQLYAEFEMINERRRAIESGTKAQSAFITFETQVGYLRCLDLFSEKKHNIVFQGKRLDVRPAPPPSTVLWQNYDYGWWSRIARRWVTTFWVLVTVSISIVLTYFASGGRQVLRLEISDSDCQLPASVSNITDLQNLIIEASDNGNRTLFDQLQAIYLECECGLATYSQAATAALDPDDICHGFWFDKAPLLGFSLLTSVIIAGTNFAIRMLLQQFANFEKHHSLVSMEVSLTWRVFLTLFFNTGLVIFIVNFDLGRYGLDFSQVVLGITGYVDFTGDWYSDVGVQILLIMIINIFAPHGFAFAEVCYAKSIRRNLNCHRPSSQRELNEWYIGPSFRMHYRIAHNLVTVFITLLYGPGLPMLYPLAVLSFTVYYWVDKYLLIRYFRTPPRYDSRLNTMASNLLFYALIPNLFFAVWMYSAPGFFWFPDDSAVTSGANQTDIGVLGNAVNFLLNNPNGSADIESIRDRLTQGFVLPLILLFFIYSIFLILLKLFESCGRFVKRVLDTVLCGLISMHEPKTIIMHPPLIKARRQNLLSGLPSYSILANPTYSAAFGISEDFAKRHKTVGSMQNLTADQLPTLPEIQ